MVIINFRRICHFDQNGSLLNTISTVLFPFYENEVFIHKFPEVSNISEYDQQ